ncbi:DUF2975 domain-containing protein [Aquincola sp. S2]|uniref:DUF2975 domain-containing protein n=1 Tax=Pseudaquabacterium terrae TaxID=2732868 RepID=A0ABX2EG58_9BURK|nr:DUF2975 domain-containing protein [Aquabacterium terrae]NRF67622.1 DUF2975 domain-containing protein [Aquabacterium terrae]
MPQNNHLPTRGLRFLIGFVRLLAVLGGVALVLVPAMFWLTPDWVRAAAPVMSGIGDHPMVIDERALLIGATVSLPSVLLGLYGLWHLWRLFGEYKAGRVFGLDAQRHLRGFAAVMLASALLAPLLRAAVGVALTLGNPPGQRMLVLTLSWNDYIAILCGAVLLAIAAVMADAVRLAEENESFV